MRAGFQWLKDNKRVWWILCGAALIAVLLLANSTGKSGLGSGGASAEEKRIAEVLSSMAGVGQVEVALFYEAEAASAFGGNAKTRPTGAVVVAEGAEDLEVRLLLSRAVRTLLGLPESAVDVFVMEGKQ